jgi:hypothetical protein
MENHRGNLQILEYKIPREIDPASVEVAFRIAELITAHRPNDDPDTFVNFTCETLAVALAFTMPTEQSDVETQKRLFTTMAMAYRECMRLNPTPYYHVGGMQ